MRAVGRYTLLAKLGGGGMADVYLAAPTSVPSPKTEDLIALKMPRKDVGDDPEFVAMFLDEAKLAARLDHPNIVKTIEVGESNGTQFIAMEYLEGQPFSRIIPKIPDLSLEIQIEILLNVLAGIHYAHNVTDESGKPLNVVHRDLTPQNVFVTYDGLVKILDFGIARAEGRSSKTRAGQIKGKVSYMSPEQARGRELDRRADLFAIGVMLFEACTGKRMWEGAKDVDVLTTLLARRHNRSPQLIKPDVPDDLDAICQRALSVIEHRYQTAAEVLADLERYVADNVERPSRELLGRTVSEAFKEKRATTRATIDAQIKKRVAPAPLRDSAAEVAETATKANTPPPPPKRVEPDMEAAVAEAFDQLDLIGRPLSTPDLRAHESDKTVTASATNGTPAAPTPKAPPTPPRPPLPPARDVKKDPVVTSDEADLPLVVPEDAPPSEPPEPPPEPERSRPKVDHVSALANSHVPTQTARRKAASRPELAPEEEPGLPAGLTPLKMIAWIIAVAVIAVLLTLVAQRLLAG